MLTDKRLVRFGFVLSFAAFGISLLALAIAVNGDQARPFVARVAAWLSDDRLMPFRQAAPKQPQRVIDLHREIARDRAAGAK